MRYTAVIYQLNLITSSKQNQRQLFNEREATISKSFESIKVGGGTFLYIYITVALLLFKSGKIFLLFNNFFYLQCALRVFLFLSQQTEHFPLGLCGAPCKQ